MLKLGAIKSEAVVARKEKDKDIDRIPINDDDEDWLRIIRKGEQQKKKARMEQASQELEKILLTESEPKS